MLNVACCESATFAMLPVVLERCSTFLVDAAKRKGSVTRSRSAGPAAFVLTIG